MYMYMYNYKTRPLVLAPVLKEGDCRGKDVIQSDQDGQRLTNVLKHRLQKRFYKSVNCLQFQ